MIPYRLDQTLDSLHGPSREQLIVGNQWAATALDLYHAGSAANVECDIDGVPYSIRLTWDSGFSKSAMRERKDMANHGAVAMAMFVMAVLLNFNYVEQTEIGDGVDYNFLENEPDENDLNFMADGHLVEMSGILEENRTNTVLHRIREKHSQIDRGSLRLRNSSVIVTLFSQPRTVKELHR